QAGEFRKSAVVYQSEGNGTADISLTLHPNQTFLFNMVILPQPDTTEEFSVIESAGQWSKQEEWIRLKFGNKKILAGSLFDTTFVDSPQFRVVDDSTVDINDTLDFITIWGINCSKVK
ncbi:MAG: hypothetical protein WD052_04330, partial [Bacteroidales bacterium]